MNFKIGDRVRINKEGERNGGETLGRAGVMTRVYTERVSCPAMWVKLDGKGHDNAYYMKWFDLDQPLSPFEHRVRAYIARELPNG